MSAPGVSAACLQGGSADKAGFWVGRRTSTTSKSRARPPTIRGQGLTSRGAHRACSHYGTRRPQSHAPGHLRPPGRCCGRLPAAFQDVLFLYDIRHVRANTLEATRALKVIS